MDESHVNHDIQVLVEVMRKLGSPQPDGSLAVPYGQLYDATTDVLEALMGTLKAAKKRGFISYDAPILLKGAHDKVPVVLLAAHVSG